MKVDTTAIEQEIAAYEKQLRQHYSTKSRLMEEIDSLDPDDRLYKTSSVGTGLSLFPCSSPEVVKVSAASAAEKQYRPHNNLQCNCLLLIQFILKYNRYS